MLRTGRPVINKFLFKIALEHLCLKMYKCTRCVTGILAGVWPCGTITIITELFIAEGKSQVYGNIHGLLQEHPENTAQLGKPCVGSN